jgi:hypothetical protein
MDPLFTNRGTNDFTLQAGSPAIDAGAALPAIVTDQKGVSRPQDAGLDIGAYEFGTPAAPAAAPVEPAAAAAAPAEAAPAAAAAEPAPVAAPVAAAPAEVAAPVAAPAPVAVYVGD